MHPIIATNAVGAFLPDRVLWECVQALTSREEIQAASMLSLTFGAEHSPAARSMLWAICRVLRPSSVVETGTNHGLTAAYVWKLNRALDHQTSIVTVDLAASTLAPHLWKRLGAQDAILFIQGDSAARIREHGQPGVEFAVIDGDHSYQGAERDWRAIEPLLAKRAVVLFDNMQHPDGCGQFAQTLNPLWFHPEMAFVVQGLSTAELQGIFEVYIDRQLASWMAACSSRWGERVRERLQCLMNTGECGSPECLDPQRTAAICRDLTTLARNPEGLRLSELTEISRHYGIGNRQDVSRQRLREGLPKPLLHMLSRIYRRFKSA